ncbi:MAG: YceI family protein [Desulfobacteraceae bacterium]|nr:YceI family protein [Desulfobacteraceae bacterium]
MKKLILPALLLFLAMASIGSARTQADGWQIDKAHSNIYFNIRHTFAVVRGQFDDFTGVVGFHPDRIEDGHVEFKADVASINTGIDQRDAHLRTADFFDAEKFAFMAFKSSRIRHVKDDQYILEGELTVKGVSKQVEIPFAYLGMRENPMDPKQMVAGFEADFHINRLDYNVGSGKFADMGVVGKTVDITVTIEMLKDR